MARVPLDWELYMRFAPNLCACVVCTLPALSHPSPLGSGTGKGERRGRMRSSRFLLQRAELQKVSKRLFAPPLIKSKTAFAQGEQKPHRKQEDDRANAVPLNHTSGNGPAAKLKRAHCPKVCTKDQDKKQTKVEEEVKQKKQRDITKKEGGKESSCLKDSVFEEVVESVLKKSLEECMEDFRKIAPSAEEHSLERENVAASFPTEEAVPGEAGRVEDEKMLLETEQQKPQPGKRRLSRASPKDNSKKNEDPEADNGGRKESRKGAPKKKVQGNAQIVHQEEKQKEGEEEEEAADEGSCSWCVVWVQCSYPACGKWRRIRSDVDPSVLPDDWTCSQNPDLQYNSCSVPEEMWSESESEVVYAVYIPGSIVWAKQYGYPWWPGMIEADPDIGEYFLFSSPKDSLPSKYHVTFFGDPVSRAWISASMLRNFGEPNAEENCLSKPKSKGDPKNLKAAQTMAKEAEQISILERIRIFGFCNRFSGKDHKGHKMPLVVPRCKDAKAKQPSSCTDSSHANLLPPGHPGEKGSLNKAKTSQVEENNLVLNKIATNHEEPGALRVFGDEEEENCGSQKITVFVEEKNNSPEEFSLALFEE
ncbi:zinc finger CW-type PWWP domain protein 1 [Sphaerodactylus townsendi]|uniref:zinc finger CW-type PWWP domain protein 1 n=1 Tax=Sphaerodactylus townsendi TaxID=933632 RepID=UPI0020273AFA|nr:zinc finger CW-type PWWP domain protein 1 [Sphaerodactylus townsendi]